MMHSVQRSLVIDISDVRVGPEAGGGPGKRPRDGNFWTVDTDMPKYAHLGGDGHQCVRDSDTCRG